jgi:hypothetical protein
MTVRGLADFRRWGHQQCRIGVEPTSLYALAEAVQSLLGPHNRHKLKPYRRNAKPERNARLLTLYQQGYTLGDLSREFHISEQRAHQIISRYS